ncbi:MAG: ATP synthase F1 subunit gamma [Oligoflexia bacterium]
MPSIKDLKKRIGTVKNTQQTTRAMKMVSAAKLRRAQEAITANRPYAAELRALLTQVSQEPGVSADHPLLKREATEPAETRRKALLLVVSSDRGLCGGFNGNIFRGAQRWVRKQQSALDVTLAFVGRKGFEYFKNRREFPVGTYFSEVTGKVSFAQARKLSDALIQGFVAGEYDEVHVIYNEFKNAVSQRVVVEQFLPLDLTGQTGQSGAENAGLLIVRPTTPEVFSRLVEKSFSTQIFRVLLDSQASEHGARMSAMENATKNAGEMIRKLTLQFNKQRQAGITKELLEIISGSESQKAAQ